MVTSQRFVSRKTIWLSKWKPPKALFHTYLEILSASRMRSVSADIALCTAKATSGLVTLSNRPQVYCLSPYFHGPAPRRGPAYFLLLRRWAAALCEAVRSIVSSPRWTVLARRGDAVVVSLVLRCQWSASVTAHRQHRHLRDRSVGVTGDPHSLFVICGIAQGCCAQCGHRQRPED